MRVTLTGKLASGVSTKDLTISMIGRLSSAGATYMAVEFDGGGIASLSPDSRAALSNMMAEMGAKNACMAPDEATWRWLEETLPKTRPTDYERRLNHFRERALYPDPGATYAYHHHFDLSEIEPMISCPHSVDNAQPLSQLAATAVDIGFIGTCTNGRLEDIKAAAEIVRGRQLRKRLIVIPASSLVLRDAAEAGYVTDLIDAGATNRHARLRTLHGQSYGGASPRRGMYQQRQSKLPRAHGRA